MRNIVIKIEDINKKNRFGEWYRPWQDDFKKCGYRISRFYAQPLLFKKSHFINLLGV